MSDIGDGTVPDVRWQRSYERSAVERFVEEVAAERQRLEREIAEAEGRAAAADAEAGARQQHAQAGLGALVLAAQQELAQLEREHALLIERIRTSAEAEASRLLRAAGEEAATMRAAATSLAGHLRPNGHTDPWDGEDENAPADEHRRVDVG
jgi:cell division septum initiation protein DivIVA